MMEQPADTFVKVARYPQFSFDFGNKLVMNNKSKRVHHIGEVVTTRKNSKQTYYHVGKLLYSAQNDVPYKEAPCKPSLIIQNRVKTEAGGDWIADERYYGLLINLKEGKIKKVFSGYIFSYKDKNVSLRINQKQNSKCISVYKVLYSVKYNIPYEDTPSNLVIKTALNIGAVDLTGWIRKDEYPGVVFDLDKKKILRVATGKIYTTGSIGIKPKGSVQNRKYIVERLLYSIINRIDYKSVGEEMVIAKSGKPIKKAEFAKIALKKWMERKKSTLREDFSDRIDKEIKYMLLLQQAQRTGNYHQIISIVYDQHDYAKNRLMKTTNSSALVAASYVDDALMPTVESIMGGRFFGYPNDILYKYALGAYLKSHKRKQKQFNESASYDDYYD